jgi:hypothetical protein
MQSFEANQDYELMFQTIDVHPGKDILSLKVKDLPLRKRQCTNKAKTIKLKDYLKRKVEKERRNAAKKNHHIGMKQYLIESIDEVDEAISDEILENYLRKELENEDRNYDEAYRLHDYFDICDCCNEVLPGKVKFYLECEQFLCQKCLLDEN